MLTSLKIENIAVIEQAEILFGEGLNVLTGETGAGKSIVIDSINAVLGERTSRDLIRDSAEKGKVTAFFENIPEAVTEKLREYEIDCEDDGSLLITRVISSDGRSSSKINGCNVTATMLKNIGRDLISICGQHDSQYLLSTDYHLKFIDDIANSNELLGEYLEVYDKIRKATKELRKLQNTDFDKEQRLDFLKYQINELKSADLKIGEKEALKEEKRKILSREKIENTLRKADMILNGDEFSGGMNSALHELSKCLDELRDFDKKYDSLYSSLEDMRYIISDCSAEVSSSLSESDSGYTDINAVEERLDILYRLSSKYGETEEEMLSYLQKIEEEYESISMSDELIEKLEDEIDELSEELFKKGCCLSDLRKITALEFEKKVMEELKFLDMPDAVFTVNFEEAQATKTGMDEVEFLFSANRGQSPKPLSKIASGGELSRVMLAIRCVLSDTDTVSTMIFDEIDTGVSGRAAQKIAYKMHEIAFSKQVLCVTHLAQIAVYGNNHLLIEKKTEGDNTYTSVRSLSDSERTYEIARIIGGDVITEKTLSSAEELISYAKNGY
ncbi:MAG: DNA repair protein RecN [Clostridia bacterium]|nr:DNA repair protein RecN [Clostridia bacterium]MBQ5904723.1 DNA repair protein RecN [Clostridia bacterium]